MTPVTFDGCFGWLHPGAGRTGVVLCGAFGHENMNAHRGWIALAERLAARGLHVVRFDYPGTGDSSGSETDPDRLAAWQGGICAAVDFLRSATDTDGVILIGLRLGATLALMASSRIDRVEAVACLAPVVSGRSYQRELRLLGNAWREANHLAVEQQPSGDLDVVGERLTRETLRDLSAIDLRQLRVSVPHILLMQDGEGPQTAGLADNLTGQGCAVSRAGFVEASTYLQDSLSSRVPEAAFAVLLEWCERRLQDPRPPASTPPSHRQTETLLRLPGATETAFGFGSDDRLFGILCLPDGGADPAAPTVIMVNTGFGRHIGDGRVFVTLARRLASMGVASLRMDIAGFGDSRQRDASDPQPYAPGASDDVGQAVEALDRAGHARPILVGICSGANAVFHGALDNPRVRGLILVNLQKFIWKMGTSLKIENSRQRRPLGFYIRSVIRAKAWRRLVSGHVDVTAIIVVMGRRLLSGVHHRLCLSLETILGIETRSGQVVRYLRTLDARKVELSLLYSEADPGLSELTHQFRRNYKGLQEMPHVRVEMLPKADHALLDRTARAQFIEASCRIVDRCIDTKIKRIKRDAIQAKFAIPPGDPRSTRDAEVG